MINHFGIAVKNLEASEKFYEAVLTPLGYKIHYPFEGTLSFTDGISTDPYGDFWISVGEPYPFHFAFQAESHYQVDAFYKKALENGGENNGAPGFRLNYHEKYYACFIIDPDGYRIEAVCHK